MGQPPSFLLFRSFPTRKTRLPAKKYSLNAACQKYSENLSDERLCEV